MIPDDIKIKKGKSKICTVIDAHQYKWEFFRSFNNNELTASDRCVIDSLLFLFNSSSATRSKFRFLIDFQKISDLSGVSISTLYKSLNKIESYGFITQEKYRGKINGVSISMTYFYKRFNKKIEPMNQFQPEIPFEDLEPKHFDKRPSIKSHDFSGKKRKVETIIFESCKIYFCNQHEKNNNTKYAFTGADGKLLTTLLTNIKIRISKEREPNSKEFSIQPEYLKEVFCDYVDYNYLYNTFFRETAKTLKYLASSNSFNSIWPKFIEHNKYNKINQEESDDIFDLI